MEMISIKIEGYPYLVEKGITILEAAKRCGYEIPSLCDFNHGECSQGSCRVCLVEVKGARSLVASCVYPVFDGMEINITSPKAAIARRTSVELLLSNHSMKCQQCDKNGRCELLHVAKLTGAKEDMFIGEKTPTTVDMLNPAIVRDTSKCILCGRCVARCKNAHGNGVLGFENRGFNTIIAPAGNRSFDKSPCILCGQCVSVCPTGALMLKSEIDKVDEAMAKGRHVIVQTAPAVRAALGEEFGMKIGTPVTGKMVAALRRLGFEKVFDTDFGADLTIMEEGSEFIERFTHRDAHTWPMFTSCCPGWIQFAEKKHPEIMPYISTCKSPMQMLSALIVEQQKDCEKKHFNIAVMPCTGKKFEAARSEFTHDGKPDVDAVITTQELIHMIRTAGIEFDTVVPEAIDAPFGMFSGAGVIFGATGGVTEAVLRRVSDDKSINAIRSIGNCGVRGTEGVKEFTVPFNGGELRIAVVSGLGNAEKLIKQLLAKEVSFDFVEVMACPGGCVNGGGQPVTLENAKKVRADGLYSSDMTNTLKTSDTNPLMDKLYADYVKGRNHEMLHVHYKHN